VYLSEEKENFKNLLYRFENEGFYQEITHAA
jgi:hypothetical protein